MIQIAPSILSADFLHLEKDVETVTWDQSIKGKVVAVKENSLMHGYRDIAHQLYFVNSGFGVEAKSRGRACYGWNLYTGEKCRIERPDVLGIVPENKLPEFAKQMLETVKEKVPKENNYEVR